MPLLLSKATVVSMRPRKPRARPAVEHTETEWDAQRLNIERTYITNDVALDDLPEVMEREFGFAAK